MIEYAKGNMLLCDDCEAIVNATNCRGVMGAGLARAFAEAYPVMYKDYQRAHMNDELSLGKLHTWHTGKKNGNNPKWVVNFPTMDLPGEMTRRDSLEQGFDALVQFITDNKVKSVALPALGCGIGRFPWNDFKAMVHEFAKRVPGVLVKVYEPH